MKKPREYHIGDVLIANHGSQQEPHYMMYIITKEEYINERNNETIIRIILYFLYSGSEDTGLASFHTGYAVHGTGLILEGEDIHRETITETEMKDIYGPCWSDPDVMVIPSKKFAEAIQEFSTVLYKLSPELAKQKGRRKE